jgi:hypothetical protein
MVLGLLVLNDGDVAREAIDGETIAIHLASGTYYAATL